MKESDVRRAVAAAGSIASSCELTVDEAVVVHNSDKLTLQLRPCDVLARVTPAAHQVARFEIELAQRLAERGSPVAALEPRVEPRGYERDGFVVTLWTYYPTTPGEISPTAYADALERLHAGMRTLDVPARHFTDRVEHARRRGTTRRGSASRLLLRRDMSPVPNDEALRRARLDRSHQWTPARLQQTV